MPGRPVLKPNSKASLLRLLTYNIELLDGQTFTYADKGVDSCARGAHNENALSRLSPRHTFANRW